MTNLTFCFEVAIHCYIYSDLAHISQSIICLRLNPKMNILIKIVRDEIISYREMCDLELKQTLQRGMNYRINPAYSVILMSQRANAPYLDKMYADGITVEYEGHDTPRRGYAHNPKSEDQPSHLPSGRLTQNGLFIKAVDDAKNGLRSPELVKIYEKVMNGVWSFKGYFDLVDYKRITNETRSVFRFILRLSEVQENNLSQVEQHFSQTRLIPSEVKKVVWKRDGGKCVICGSSTNLHFDHDLPFSKGGTSLSDKNVRLLCAKHNLEKSAKIE